MTKRPNVDIIIPFHGHYGGVTRLLESIFRYTFSHKYQITLVDDASPNKEYIKSLAKTVNCLRLEEHQGFGAAIKHGFENTKQPLVVFINSDCIVEDIGWLTAMEATLKKAAMTSPKTNNAVNGDKRQEGERGEDIILDQSFLSMYCFMCARSLFSKVGFVKVYPYYGYEDEEFAYRLRKHNLKQAICGQGWVRHEGYATITEVCRKDTKVMKIITEDNRKRAILDML